MSKRSIGVIAVLAALFVATPAQAGTLVGNPGKNSLTVFSGDAYDNEMG